VRRKGSKDIATRGCVEAAGISKLHRLEENLRTVNVNITPTI
jgi:hypothetical protein